MAVEVVAGVGVAAVGAGSAWPVKSCTSRKGTPALSAAVMALCAGSANSTCRLPAAPLDEPGGANRRPLWPAQSGRSEGRRPRRLPTLEAELFAADPVAVTV